MGALVAVAGSEEALGLPLVSCSFTQHQMGLDSMSQNSWWTLWGLLGASVWRVNQNETWLTLQPGKPPGEGLAITVHFVLRGHAKGQSLGGETTSSGTCRDGLAKRRRDSGTQTLSPWSSAKHRSKFNFPESFKWNVLMWRGNSHLLLCRGVPDG